MQNNILLYVIMPVVLFKDVIIWLSICIMEAVSTYKEESPPNSVLQLMMKMRRFESGLVMG